MQPCWLIVWMLFVLFFCIIPALSVIVESKITILTSKLEMQFLLCYLHNILIYFIVLVYFELEYFDLDICQIGGVVLALSWFCRKYRKVKFDKYGKTRFITMR